VTKQWLCVLVGLLGLGVAVGAVDGRDFAGTYSLGSPSQMEQGILVTFTADVQNVSGAALAGVSFELTVATPVPLATFTPIDLDDAVATHLTQQLVVSASTYTELAAGNIRLVGAWTDAEGNRQARVVELNQVPAVEEVQQ
jgi:hypothetical protein